MIDADKGLRYLILAIHVKIKQLNEEPRKLQKIKLRKQLLKLYHFYKLLKRSSNKKERRWWVRCIFQEERRALQGASENLIREMETHDPEVFKNFLRFTPAMFYELLDHVEHRIYKQYAVRKPIEATTRLEVLLRFLGSGNSMRSLSYEFRIGVSTIKQIIEEVCDAIWNKLKDTFVQLSHDDWNNIAQGYEETWNLPNCIGAIDGRHMAIRVGV